MHIWLYDSQGNLVLQKRSESKDTFPGRWDVSVGGHVTSGDTVMETALKEVEEELVQICMYVRVRAYMRVCASLLTL